MFNYKLFDSVQLLRARIPTRFVLALAAARKQAPGRGRRGPVGPAPGQVRLQQHRRDQL